MSIDGQDNSVHEFEVVPEPRGTTNPQGNAFYPRKTPLTTESKAQRVIDPLSSRCWIISNPSTQNALGEPTAYKLIPGDNTLPLPDSDASVTRRGAFATKNLWVTPYSPKEKAAAGDYVNQNPGGDGLPKWTQADRSIEDTDIVVWYSFGLTHVSRPEDWPIMPVTHTGFAMRPVGFFDMNPSLDVPPSTNHDVTCHT